jgi:hypothetical protein
MSLKNSPATKGIFIIFIDKGTYLTYVFFKQNLNKFKDFLPWMQQLKIKTNGSTSV